MLKRGSFSRTRLQAACDSSAPPHFVSEVDSAIRKRVFDGKMTSEEARKAYAILDAAPVQIVDVAGLRQRAREIAEQFNQRFVYDATYAALAELRGCEFWTADRMFYNAVKGALAFVKYLPDYLDIVKFAAVAQQRVSLRAQRSNLPPSNASNVGDCFVAPLLAMTLGLESNNVKLFMR